MTNDQLLWAYQGRTLVGGGDIRKIDPGVGPERYRRALEALRQSEAGVAFASFTFDPDEPGSVVMVPSEVSARGDDATESVPRGHVDSDGKPLWESGITGALDALKAGQVEKVVLTRQVTLQFDEAVPAKTVAQSLMSSQPRCYVFVVDDLVGASPELLASLTNGQVSSLVLAGTGPDRESLQSEKMDLEHVLAASSVQDGIAGHVTAMGSPTRTVLEFGDLVHLATRFEGNAVNGSSVLDVVASLHPTASVAGTPTEKAIELIRELEPTVRGRYAGPVGWFNTEGEGEFAIALRCGFIDGNRVTLFAGGGLVEGSDPVSEFAETELKLRPMLAALGLD